MNIAPNGNVGIGLDAGGTPPAPAARLHIISDNQQFLFGTGTCTSGYSLGIGVNDDGVNFNLNTGLRGFNFINANLGANPNGRLLTISATGNVAIGNTNPQGYKLAVEGVIGARRIKVTQESWADFVFNNDYQLPAIHEVADFIEQNKHLPGIPTTLQVKEEGIDLGEMNKLLLQKVEEQMLYIIQLNKQVQELSQKLRNQEK